jgi:hypothetical protein
VVEGLPGIQHVLDIVGPWLGPVKRDQALTAIARFAAQNRVTGDRDHCKRGHAYDRRVTRSGHDRAICNACERLMDRRDRFAQGIAPREFKNVGRRYTE